MKLCQHKKFNRLISIIKSILPKRQLNKFLLTMKYKKKNNSKIYFFHLTNYLLYYKTKYRLLFLCSIYIILGSNPRESGYR